MHSFKVKIYTVGKVPTSITTWAVLKCYESLHLYFEFHWTAFSWKLIWKKGPLKVLDQPSLNSLSTKVSGRQLNDTESTKPKSKSISQSHGSHTALPRNKIQRSKKKKIPSVIVSLIVFLMWLTVTLLRQLTLPVNCESWKVNENQ